MTLPSLAAAEAASNSPVAAGLSVQQMHDVQQVARQRTAEMAINRVRSISTARIL